MIIYVQSRGKNQDQDYRWLRINSQECYSDNPDFLLYPINNSPVRAIDLIESQKPSVILVAKHNDYYLLVTGLKAKRTDFMGRPIRNSVLWVVKKDRKNIIIRSLLIQALKGELDRAIDKTINIAGEYGFEVDYKALKKLSNSTLAIGNNDQIDLNCKIGKNCDFLQEEIALELESNVLPNREGLLVLVTSIKSASALKEAGVWRGLSNRVESETLEKYNSSAIIQSGTEKKTLWIWVAIASILIIAIALIIIKFTMPQQPQIEPSSPNLDKSTQLEEKSGNFSKKKLTSIKLPSDCQIAKKENLFLSPCFLNNSNN